MRTGHRTGDRSDRLPVLYRAVNGVDFEEFSELARLSEESGATGSDFVRAARHPKTKRAPSSENLEGARAIVGNRIGYQFFGFMNHHQRSVRGSNFRSQYPSSHSSVTL